MPKIGQMGDGHEQFGSDESATIHPQLGADRVATQLSTFLPQVHLTLVSVLQAAALAVLAGRTADVDPLQLPDALLYVDAIVFAAVVWYAYAWAFVAYIWPLSTLHSLLHFGLAAAEGFAFVSIHEPARWVGGIAAAAAFGAAIRYWNTQLLGRHHYEDAAQGVFEDDQRAERDAALLYGLVALLLGGMTVALAVSSSQVLVWLAALLVLGFLAYIAWSDQRGGDENFRILLRGSPWTSQDHMLVLRTAVEKHRPHQD